MHQIPNSRQSFPAIFDTLHAMSETRSIMKRLVLHGSYRGRHHCGEEGPADGSLQTDSWQAYESNTSHESFVHLFAQSAIAAS